MSSGRRPDPALVLPAAAVGAVGGGAFLWRTLTWEAAASPDAWAYAAWGQAVARGERPLFELGATTPKPLATLLGAVVVPLPPDRALAVIVALALGALAASLFAAAYREGGAAAASVAVVALAAGAQLDLAVAFAYIDAVVAALVLTAIALQGRLRIAILVLAGLLRPEAWLLAAVAGYSETTGSRPRKLGGALAVGAVAPALWMISDLVLMGDALGTVNWQSDFDREPIPWRDIPGEFVTALRNEGGTVLAAAGIVGLGLHYARARRHPSADPLPLAVAVLWSSLVALEAGFGAALNARYLLPVVAVLALGCGLLVATFVPSRLRAFSPWLAVAIAAGALVFAAGSMDLGPRVPLEIARNRAVTEVRPTVEAVLDCGRLGLAGEAARATAPRLAASSRRSLHEFSLYPGGGSFAAVLHVTPKTRRADPLLPPWERRNTPLGPLAIAPRCVAPG
jgi:hypothetical protein